MLINSSFNMDMMRLRTKLNSYNVALGDFTRDRSRNVTFPVVKFRRVTLHVGEVET